MAGNEKEFKGVTIGTYTEDNRHDLIKDLHKHVKGDVVFFCVGTDRSTGDSFAPMVGMMLKEKGYENVIGTLDDPVHATNISERIKEIPEGKTVIAIDACLGRLKNVGNIILNSGQLFAGKGVGKDLPPVGDFHIQGIVNVDGLGDQMNFMVLSNTRLSKVYNMAKQCAIGLESAFPLQSKTELRLIKIN
jgi:putative sporulation protein YyaC